MGSPTIFVVLPAFNEEAALAQLLPDIHAALQGRFPYKIVLADDGSTDSSAARVPEWGQAVNLVHLRHPKNQGYGAALNTAITCAIEQAAPDDVILTLDADNTHPPHYFPALIAKIQEGYDVCSTTYWSRGGRSFGVPFKRKLFSRAVNWMFYLCAPMKATRAYTNGFRAYRAGILQRVAQQSLGGLIEESGFPGGAELLLKARAAGARDAEIPFELHYERRGAGTKIRIAHTIRAYLKLIARVVFDKKAASAERSNL